MKYSVFVLDIKQSNVYTICSITKSTIGDWAKIDINCTTKYFVANECDIHNVFCLVFYEMIKCFNSDSFLVIHNNSKNLTKIKNEISKRPNGCVEIQKIEKSKIIDIHIVNKFLNTKYRGDDSFIALLNHYNLKGSNMCFGIENQSLLMIDLLNIILKKYKNKISKVGFNKILEFQDKVTKTNNNWPFVD